MVCVQVFFLFFGEFSGKHTSLIINHEDLPLLCSFCLFLMLLFSRLIFTSQQNHDFRPSRLSLNGFPRKVLHFVEVKGNETNYCHFGSTWEVA